MQEHSYTVQVELCTVPELLHRLIKINDCSMFRAVLVAFEVLPHIRSAGTERTRQIRGTSSSHHAAHTCMRFVPRLLWDGYV